jgi:hypothetical protein
MKMGIFDTKMAENRQNVSFYIYVSIKAND